MFSMIAALLIALCLAGNAQAVMHGGNSNAMHDSHPGGLHGGHSEMAVPNHHADMSVPCLSIMGQDESRCDHCGTESLAEWIAPRLRSEGATSITWDERALAELSAWRDMLDIALREDSDAPPDITFFQQDKLTPSGAAIIQLTQRFRI